MLVSEIMKPSIIAYCGLKGGTGKTVSTITTAASIHNRGLPVTVIDCDSEQSAANWALGGLLPFEVVPMLQDQLGKQARALKDSGQFVVVDTSPNNREILMSAAYTADYVIVPTAVTGHEINRLIPTLAVLQEVQLNRGKDDLVSILLTRWQRNRVLSREFLEAFDDYPILESKINNKAIYQKEFGVMPSFTLEYSNVLHEVLDSE